MTEPNDSAEQPAMVGCAIIVHLHQASGELSSAFRAINKAHTGHEEVPIDESCTSQHQEAAHRVCMARSGTLALEVQKDGGLVPRFLDLEGRRYRLVLEP